MMRMMVIVQRTMVIRVVGMNDNRNASGWQDNIFQSVQDSCGKNEKELYGSLDRKQKARLNQAINDSLVIFLHFPETEKCSQLYDIACPHL